MAGRRLAVHGVCLLRLRASRPLRAVLDMRLLRLRAGRPLRAVLDMRLLRLRAGRPLCAVLDMRLLRLRARRVLLLLLLYRARAGSARLSLLLLRTTAGGLRRTLRWALRAGWLSFVTKQLIKVLKMIGHGLISLSTWNASLRPHGAGTPFPLGAYDKATDGNGAVCPVLPENFASDPCTARGLAAQKSVARRKGFGYVLRK